MTVTAGSNVIGRTIRDTGFRGRFDAAVIAVKRNNIKQVRPPTLWPSSLQTPRALKPAFNAAP